MATRVYTSGPAILRRGGVTIYAQQGIELAYQTKSDEIKADFYNDKLGEFVLSRVASVKVRPVDCIANLSAFFGLGHAQVGGSIMAGSSRAITGVSVANPSILTFAAPHHLGAIGDTIEGTLAGFTTSASINGTQTLTILSATTASVPVNVASTSDQTGTFIPVSEPLEIVTKAGQIMSFERSGVRTPPNLHLGISSGFFASDLELACLGSLSKTQTSDDYFHSLLAQTFSDATFDPSTIKRYPYSADYGSVTGIKTKDGFTVMIDQTVEELPDDEFGVGDLILTGLNVSSKFTPINLTQAQVETLLGLQDTDALVPGTIIGRDGSTPLVITGEDAATGLVVTLNGHGFKDGNFSYTTGQHRNGELTGVSRLTFTAGVLDDLYTLDITTP